MFTLCRIRSYNINSGEVRNIFFKCKRRVICTGPRQRLLVLDAANTLLLFEWNDEHEKLQLIASVKTDIRTDASE